MLQRVARQLLSAERWCIRSKRLAIHFSNEAEIVPRMNCRPPIVQILVTQWSKIFPYNSELQPTEFYRFLGMRIEGFLGSTSAVVVAGF